MKYYILCKSLTFIHLDGFFCKPGWTIKKLHIATPFSSRRDAQDAIDTYTVGPGWTTHIYWEYQIIDEQRAEMLEIIFS